MAESATETHVAALAEIDLVLSCTVFAPVIEGLAYDVEELGNRAAEKARSALAEVVPTAVVRVVAVRGVKPKRRKMAWEVARW